MTSPIKYPYIAQVVVFNIVASLKEEKEALEKEVGDRETVIADLNGKIKYLELRVKDLNAKLYGQKADRRAPCAENQSDLPFSGELESSAPEAKTESPKRSRRKSTTATGQKKGPKPFPEHLERNEIKVEDPDLKDLICPVTGKLMTAGIVERKEVLRVIPARYVVDVYVRNVFVSPAQEAPVYTLWPANILENTRIDISVVADVIYKRFALHQPYYRQSEDLKRFGLSVAPNTMQNWAKKLGELVTPLDDALLSSIVDSGYVGIDGTSVKLLDPARPGKAASANIWTYRALDGPVYFQFAKTKKGDKPSETMKDFKGVIQTDGANNFGPIVDNDNITHLGCFAHLRRYFVEAENLGQPESGAFVDKIDRIFRAEKLARWFNLPDDKIMRLREHISIPLWKLLKDDALKFRVERAKTYKLPLEKACNYLLNHKTTLDNCLLTQGSRIDNNLVEQAIRPLKIGSKNWLFIGNPSAGYHNMKLFNLVCNCKLAAVDVVDYLSDVMMRLQDYPNKLIKDFIPQNWSKLSKN